MQIQQQSMRLRVFDIEDLAIGRLLGVGGCSSVFSVGIRPSKGYSFGFLPPEKQQQETSETKCDNENSTELLRNRCLLSMTSTSRSSSSLSGASAAFNTEQRAMKKIHKKVLDCPDRTKSAFEDMHNEIKILSNLPYHPNIIQVSGLSTDFWISPKTAFFIQEQLVESLDKKMDRWKQMKNTSTSSSLSFGFKNSFFGGAKQHLSQAAQIQRIQKVAIGISSAMALLHEQRIIFRDIKPANIGLDLDGQARLFDFGLATYIENSEHPFLKGQAGTLRYMAPEVARLEEYTFSADVYSFGMLLWELCTLERPYEEIKDTDALVSVVNTKQPKDKYPGRRLSRIHSPEIRTLLKECWSPVPSMRPSFEHIYVRLHCAIKRSNN
ncbi:hypothetical protein ACA910_005314 [Epithemia clementina (nom. ined.)]